MTTPVIRVRNLVKRLDGREVLRGITFDIRPGEIFVIMGPSGGGKSVLLKHLVGLFKPDEGEVFLWDQPVHLLDEEALAGLRERVGYVFQAGALFDSLTVAENVAFPLRRHRRLDDAAISAQVAEGLTLVELEGAEPKMPDALSGGMRKRVGIARAIVLRPEIVFYDEPTGELDPPTARAIDALIAQLRDRLGVTSVVVTHDLDTAFGIGDRIAMMHDGRLLAVGPAQAILTDPQPEIHNFLHPRMRSGPPAARNTAEVSTP